MARNGEHLMMDEADIGSGEKNPADAETQKMIEQIPQWGLNSSAPVDRSSKDQPSQGNTR
jgi:hypothetical protein